MSQDTWALIRSREVLVVAILFIVPTDVRDSFELALERRAFLDDGDNVTFAIGTKIPYLAGHSKYLEKNSWYFRNAFFSTNW